MMNIRYKRITMKDKLIFKKLQLLSNLFRFLVIFLLTNYINNVLYFSFIYETNIISILNQIKI